MDNLFNALFEHIKSSAIEGVCSSCGRVAEENYHGKMICKFSSSPIEECAAEPLPAFVKVKEEANPEVAAGKAIDKKTAALSKSEVSKEKSATKAGAAKQDAVITKAVGSDAKEIPSDDVDKLQPQGDPNKNPPADGKKIDKASAASSKSAVSGEKASASAVNAAADKQNAKATKEAVEKPAETPLAETPVAETPAEAPVAEAKAEKKA